MNRWYFWKSWHPQSRSVYWFLIIILGALLLYFGYHFFASPAPAIDWQKISTIEKVKVPGEGIRVGLFNFSYEFDNYVVTESYQGSAVQIRSLPIVIQLLLIALSLLLFLVVSSALQGFWFYFGALIFSGILISFQLEQMLLFGESDKLGLITGLALFLSLLYFFNKIRPGSSLQLRFLAFGGLLLLFGTFLLLSAEVSHPLLYLANYGLVAPLLLSLLFILILGHVVISSLLRLITFTNSVGDSNAVWHFLIISLIYLANVFLLYGRNAGFIDWDIIYLDAFLILVVSAVLGIWDFRAREHQYQNVFTFAPLGAYFYLALAIICFSTLSYAFATANDPLVESFEDAIVFSQLSFGLLFTGYIIVNFIQPLMDNMQVYRIMYKPRTFPYGTVQIVGMIGVFAFLLNANMLPFNQAMAGYYNGVGDLYQVEENTFVAEQYYKLGDQYGYNNHRSNYSLGAMARAAGDGSLAPFYFGEAVKKRPTVFAHVNLGNGRLKNNQFFDALNSYEQGLKDFEENPYLYNNLAVAYGQTALLDSALLFLSRAAESANTQQAAETNTLGLIATNEDLLSFNLDSLLSEVLRDRSYLPGLVNAFLLANLYRDAQEPLEDESFRWLSEPDSLLNSNQFAYLYNYAYNCPQALDSTQLNELKGYASHYPNARFYESLSVLRAWVLYQQNQVSDAVRVLDTFQALNPFQRGYYNHLLGLWALQQNAPLMASEFLQKAEQGRYEGSLFRKAVSLSEATAQNLIPAEEALIAWDSLYTLETERIADTNPLVSMMREILRGIPTDFSSRDDDFLYQLLRYRFADLSPDEQTAAFEALDNPAYRVSALHDLWLLYPDDKENIRRLIQQFLPLPRLLSTDAQIYHSWLQLFLLEEEDNWQKLASLLEETPAPSRWHRQLAEYYQFQYLLNLDQSEEVERIARRMIGNPFFEKGFLTALYYLYEDPLDQYNLLLEAQQTNPDAPELKQAYVFASLRAGLESYAEASLEELRPLLSDQAYADFRQNYEQLKAEYTPDF